MILIGKDTRQPSIGPIVSKQEVKLPINGRKTGLRYPVGGAILIESDYPKDSMKEVYERELER
jgi:hypothetical protein